MRGPRTRRPEPRAPPCRPGREATGRGSRRDARGPRHTPAGAAPGAASPGRGRKGRAWRRPQGLGLLLPSQVSSQTSPPPRRPPTPAPAIARPPRQEASQHLRGTVLASVVFTLRDAGAGTAEGPRPARAGTDPVSRAGPRAPGTRSRVWGPAGGAAWPVRAAGAAARPEGARAGPDARAQPPLAPVAAGGHGHPAPCPAPSSPLRGHRSAPALWNRAARSPRTRSRRAVAFQPVRTSRR